jgi:hypothetical protein
VKKQSQRGLPGTRSMATAVRSSASHFATCSLEAASQTLIARSPLPVAMRSPSGENAAAKTHLVCPRKVSNSLPLAASHSFAVRSALPVTIRLPSDETRQREGDRCALPSRACRRSQRPQTMQAAHDPGNQTTAIRGERHRPNRRRPRNVNRSLPLIGS